MVEKYLEEHKTLWTETTYRTVASKLRRISSIKFKDPKGLYDSLVDAEYGSYTIKMYLVLYANYYRWKTKRSTYHDFLASQPHLFRNAYKEKTRRVTREHILAALSVTHESTLIANNFIRLCAFAGLRRSEAISLTWNQIKNNTIVLTGKGGKQRIVPFVEELLQGRDKLKTPCQGWEIRRDWPKVLEGFSPHDLRAFYITTLSREAGVSLKDIAAVVGHSSIETTSKYMRVDFTAVETAMRRNAI